MSDFMLLTEDVVHFDPAFGVAVVAVMPGVLEGSANASLGEKKVCVEGNEAKVKVSGCAYTTSVYSKAGSGTLTIESLAEGQKAQKTKFDEKPALLKGGKFIAKFTVDVQAMKPPTDTPDETPFYLGRGVFKTNNDQWTAE